MQNGHNSDNYISKLGQMSVDLNPGRTPTEASSRVGSVRSIQEAIKGAFRGHREEGDFTLGCLKLLHTRTRFILLVLLLLCLASVWSNILSFNFALICIYPIEDENVANVTHIPGDLNATQHTGPVVFTSRQKSYLTSAVAASALIANFAVVYLVNQFGIRTSFSILGMLSAVATFLMPMAINLGFYYVLACRVLQGVAFSANFPAIGAFTSKWTYYKQNGLFVSALVAYVQFAPAVTMPVSGALCGTSWGWPSVFYAHGMYSVILFTTFAILYRNNPAKHPLVGEIELKKIAVGKSGCSKEELRRIPYGPILKTASVWAVWIAAIGNFFCVNMMFLYSPNYLNSVLHYSPKHTGVSASLAPLAQFLIKLAAGFTSDKVRFLSETNKLRMYNSIAFFGSAFFLVVLAFFPTEYATVCLMILGISAGILGFTTGGFFKAGPLVSKHYSHFVTGNVSLGITITMLIVPFMVGGFAPNNTAEEWRWVFICTSAVLVITNLLFVIMGSAEPAHWTTDEFSRSASRNKVHSTQPAAIKQLGAEMAMG
ncbi:Protein T27D12.1 a [Aphelenchoides avenae]|nr:Protein T27D12.1 a [Aphelenchus avenae]